MAVFKDTATTRRPVKDTFDNGYSRRRDVDLYLGMMGIYEDLAAFELFRKRRDNCELKDVEIR